VLEIGNGGKGIAWNTEDEVTLLNALNTTVREEGVSKGLPKIETDIDATEASVACAISPGVSCKIGEATTSFSLSK
jgi:nitrate reductase alpha subunit